MLSLNHPNNFVGIAVHEGDIMEVVPYKDSADFVSLPTFHADRKLLNQDVADAQLVFNDLVNAEIPASLSSNVWGSGNNVTVDASATFNTVFSSADFRLGLIITEDESGEELIEDDGIQYSVQIIPCWQWILEVD